MYQIEASAMRLDDSQLVTVRLESGNFVRFQPDTVAQCNVLPLHIYKKASKLEKVNRSQASLVTYGGSKIKVMGCVNIRGWRNDKSYLLDYRLIFNKEICPILGFKSCLAMNIIQYKDNDSLNKPVTGGFPVYKVDDQKSPLTKEELMSKFPKVFRNVSLNPEKLKLQLSQVLFIRHMATDQGLKEDPAKARADLTQSNTLWIWEEAQQTAFKKLKEMVTCTPVLSCYNLKEEVTLQCDASQSGLGAALMQNRPPVAYASRALTPAETCCAQIEKELLAIVFERNRLWQRPGQCGDRP